MKFYPLGSAVLEGGDLQTEYKSGRQIGKIRLGKGLFFFRSMRKVYYIPYNEIRRYFRRVMMVPAKLCCGKGDFQMENLVICGDAGELAQIELPGTKAARVLIDCLKELAPDAVCGHPLKNDSKGEKKL